MLRIPNYCLSCVLVGTAALLVALAPLVSAADRTHAPTGSTPATAGQAKSLAKLVDRWITLREHLAQSDAKWREQKVVLEDEHRVLAREKEQVTAALREQQTANTVLSVDRDRARTRERTLKAALAGLEGPVREAESDLRTWQKRLPDFLAAPLRARFRELPGPGKRAFDPADLSKRLERVLGLYAEIEQFDQGVHVGRMILTDPDGARREMRVLFLGFGAGFALTPDGADGACAVPTADGWQWKWEPQWAQPIRAALDCYEKVRPAAFIPLPMEISGETQ